LTWAPNVGAHTVRLARLAGPAGEVIAIEPDPGVISRNKRNVELNGLSNVRCTTRPPATRPAR